MNQASPPEKPLSGGERLAMVSGAASVILLFYLFSITSVLLLVLLIGFEVCLIVALMRFGVGTILIQPANQHVALVGLLLRSFRIRKGAQLRILLKPTDAPRLFAMVESLSSQLKIVRPKTMWLDMNPNAWVHLKGFRRGAGATILGVGYDLLAGLDESEVQAVLAHEVVHAKLVQRGFKRWLTTGSNRSVSLATALASHVHESRRHKRASGVADLLLRSADRLARLGARFIAAYSRQDEFAADAGAAELCGPAAIRSALIKTNSIARLAERLPWRERVAQLQCNGGLSEWLARELATGNATSAPGFEDGLFNKYSTHPLLKDRLAALPAAAEGLPKANGPGIELLAEPDVLGEKLMAEIQRVVSEEEQKDSRRLRRWTRRTRRASHLRPLQVVGVFLLLVGAVFGISGWAITGLASVGMVFLAIAAIGILLHHLGRYRERLPLSVPDFAELNEAWHRRKDIKNPQQAEKELEDEFHARFISEKRKSRKAWALASASYPALASCDYLRAHVAARLSLEADPKLVEGALALAVAAAGLGLGPQSNWALGTVQTRAGIREPSVIWGFAWASILQGDWARAEAFLDQARKKRPHEVNFLTLLAICQQRRGKLQSAIVTARTACTPAAKNLKHEWVLIDLLLRAGFLREAHERFLNVEEPSKTDKELVLGRIQLHLLLRHWEAAQEWTQLMQRNFTGTHALVRLGQVHEAARLKEAAAGFFRRALATDHFPEAHLGLARLETGPNNNAAVRKHLIAALNTERTPGEGGSGVALLLPEIIGQLLALREPLLNGEAWIATVPARGIPAMLARRSLMIVASSRREAGEFFDELRGALLPSSPPAIPGSIDWKLAPRQQQPDGPVRPGIQGIIT